MGSIMPLKPLILIACTPVTGHMIPLQTVAAYLAAQSYSVTFIAPTSNRARIEAAGANWYPIEASIENVESTTLQDPVRNAIPPGLARTIYDIENSLGQLILPVHRSVQSALEYLENTYPAQKIIMLCEGACWGVLPTLLGAHGKQPAGVIGIGVIPVLLGSEDCAPFGPGLHPDTSPDGKIRNRAMNAEMNKIFENFKNIVAKAVESTGGKPYNGEVFDAMYTLPKYFLQMTIPELEYPRSDAPTGFELAGTLPKPKNSTWPAEERPEWWETDVVNNELGRKIVFVCQGTVSTDYSDLILPTIKGLATSPNVLVVVALGRRGVSLSPDIAIPDNTRIFDYIPFDAILPLADVYVTNGGYGGFQQGVIYGVPMVMAGTTEDKVEVCARGSWSGVGIDMKTNRLTDHDAKLAVYQILEDEKYRSRVKQLQAETMRYDPLGRIRQRIEDVTVSEL